MQWMEYYSAIKRNEIVPFAEMQTDPETIIGEISQKRKISLISGISWRRKWQPTSEFLPREFRGQRSLADYSPWRHKELDMTVQLSLIFGIYKDDTDELICKVEIEIQV